jgi:hypothetical protein
MRADKEKRRETGERMEQGGGEVLGMECKSAKDIKNTESSSQGWATSCCIKILNLGAS